MSKTKADLIREYLAKLPDEGPTSLAQKIMEENAGVLVRAQEVSTMRSKLKERGLLPALTGEEEVVAGDLADRLARLKEAADAVGGPEEAKRILDLLR